MLQSDGLRGQPANPPLHRILQAVKVIAAWTLSQHSCRRIKEEKPVEDHFCPRERFGGNYIAPTVRAVLTPLPHP